MSNPQLPSTNSSTTKGSTAHSQDQEIMGFKTVKCNICAKLGHVLDCCKGLSGCCATCADLDHIFLEDRKETNMWKERCAALEEEIEDLKNSPERLRQEKEDRIEYLKKKVYETEKEERRLDKILEERKATLRRLRAEEQARRPVQEYTIREAKKGGKGKKKHA